MASGQVSSAQHTPQPLQGAPMAGLVGASACNSMIRSSMRCNEPLSGEMIKRLPLSGKEFAMKKLLCGLLALAFSLTSLNVLACSGDKAKDEKQMSTPSKPKV